MLANIYLNDLDRIWQATCSHLGQLVRYADDFVILCRTRALYVLSVGPATWLITRGYISCEAGSPTWVLYAPLRWAARNSEAAHDFLSWYENLFVSPA